MKMRKVKVNNMPLTYIEVNSDLTDSEIKDNWLKKYNKKSEISQTSKSLEMGMIRSAKKLNKNYK